MVYFMPMNAAPMLTTTPSSRQPGLVVRLMAAGHAVQRASMDALLSSGNYTQLSLDLCLAYMERFALRDYSPSELAGELGISKQACSKMVRELERRDFIARRPCVEDSRSSVLSLTALGQQLIHDGVDAANAVQHKLTEAIGNERARRLTLVLRAATCAAAWRCQFRRSCRGWGV